MRTETHAILLLPAATVAYVGLPVLLLVLYLRFALAEGDGWSAAWSFSVIGAFLISPIGLALILSYLVAAVAIDVWAYHVVTRTPDERSCRRCRW